MKLLVDLINSIIDGTNTLTRMDLIIGRETKEDQGNDDYQL